MFGPLGGFELLVLAAIGLLVFGPRRLPEIGRTLGKAMLEFRRAATELRASIEREVHLEELKETTRAIQKEIGLDEVQDAARSIPRDLGLQDMAETVRSIPQALQEPSPSPSGPAPQGGAPSENAGSDPQAGSQDDPGVTGRAARG